MKMYTIKEKIGCGAYSNVYKVIKDDTGEKYAMKETIPNFIEIDIMTRYKHPNIANIYDFTINTSLDDPDTFSLFIITELGEYDLTKHRGLRDSNIIIDTITAVCFLHMNGIIHCDIKPDNIILVKGRNNCKDLYIAKLIDFGLSTYRSTPISNCQTMAFAPPEILVEYYDLNIHYAATYINMMATDLWALGVTIFFYITGTHIFGSKDELENNINRYFDNPISYIINYDIPHIWFPLLLLLLEPDPNTRLINMSNIIKRYKINIPIHDKNSISTISSDNNFHLSYFRNASILKTHTARSIVTLRDFGEKITNNNANNKENKSKSIGSIKIDNYYRYEELEDTFIENMYVNSRSKISKSLTDSDLITIDTNAQILLKILYKYAFSIETTFLTMDLYYRCITKLGRYGLYKYTSLACLYIGFQLTNNWDQSTECIDRCIFQHPIYLDRILQFSGYIAILLKGKLYIPNLYTGVQNINILKNRLPLLESYETYMLSKQKLSQPHCIYKIRVPLNLLI